MDEESSETTRTSVRDTIETTVCREETQNVQYEQELAASSHITSERLQTSNKRNLHSVAKEALDISQEEEPSIDAGPGSRHTLRSHPAVSAETKARWELLRTLVGVEDTRPRSVDPQGPSSDIDDSRPSIKLRRSLARRGGRRYLSTSSLHGIRPLLLPQKVLNDRAASSTRSEDYSLAFSSETQEATLSDMDELKDIMHHGSQVDIQEDHTFLSPTQNSTPPCQAQSEPRQSPSSSYTAQQQLPTPYQNVPSPMPSNQTSLAGNTSSRPSSRRLESQSPFQPTSTSKMPENEIPQSQTRYAGGPMDRQQDPNLRDQTYNPAALSPMNSQIYQSYYPQSIPQMTPQRPPSQGTKPASVPPSPRRSILPITGEEGSRTSPGPQTQQFPAPAPGLPSALQPGFPQNNQQRRMPPNQQSVNSNQQRPPLPTQQQSVPNPPQGRNSNGARHLPVAGSRPLNPPTAQLSPQTPQDGAPLGQGPTVLGLPLPIAPQSRAPRRQQLPTPNSSIVPQDRAQITPSPLPPPQGPQYPLSQNQPLSRPPQLQQAQQVNSQQQTPSPNQPLQQRLANQNSQQTTLPPQKGPPLPSRALPQNLPPSQRPSQTLPSAPIQFPQQQNVASQQNPRLSSPIPPATPPQTTPPNPNIQARQQPFTPRQRAAQSRTPQSASGFQAPSAPPQYPSPAQQATPLWNPVLAQQRPAPQTPTPTTGIPPQIQIPGQQLVPQTPTPAQRATPLQNGPPAQRSVSTQNPASPHYPASTQWTVTPQSQIPVQRLAPQNPTPGQRPATPQNQIPVQQSTQSIQSHSVAIPRPNQEPPNSLGITRKPLSQPHSSLSNVPMMASGQSKHLAQNPITAALNREQPQNGLSERIAPPQLQQQNSNAQISTPETGSQNLSQPRTPTFSESRRAPSLLPSINGVKEKQNPSMPGVAESPKEHKHKGLDPQQEYKRKQKLSLEELLALWLQGDLPDDYLSTEEGKQIVPETLFYGIVFMGKMFLQTSKKNLRRRI